MKQIIDKKDLIRSIRRVTLIIFTIGSFALAVVGLLDRFVLVKNETEKIRSEYSEEQKRIIKTQVESTVMFINLAKDAGISKEDIIESVRKIRFGKDRDGYFFIVSYDGTTLLNDTQREMEGNNQWEVTDPNGVKIVQEERRAVRNPDGDFISYSWYQPSTGILTPKVSFMKGIEEWEWMIGTGVYLDSIDEDIAALQKEILYKTGLMTLVLIITLSIILVIILLIFKRFTEKIAGEIQLFSSYFKSASVNSKEIDVSTIRYRAFSYIAEEMNRMLKNKLESDDRMYASEKRLYMQREQSPLGYVEWDLDYKVIDWNPSSERIFGFSREEILGRSHEIFIPREIIPKIKNIFKESIDESARSDKCTKSINENITKDGRRITCEWYNKVLTDKDGKILSIVSLVDDITDRKLAEEQLQKSLEEKKILLKEVHHRVKNNMAIISSFLSLQSMNIEDEYVRNLLQSSENRVRSMALIHENLYKSENLKDINVQIYIDELVATLLDSYGYESADINIKMKITQVELDLDLLVPFGMLINEIISNALKHAFNNIESPELSISLVDGKQGELILTINDNGIGLPEKSKLDQDDSIGFMLINGLVQQIDGKMEIHRNNGTGYKITIPV